MGFTRPSRSSGSFLYITAALRAFVEANDPASHWPRATRARLLATDPELFAYIERVFNVEFTQTA